MIPRLHKFLYFLYFLVWIFLAIDPRYREDWLLENILVFIFFPTVIWLDFKYRFTLISVVFLLIFGIFHAIGAHYTYAQMPYFDVFTNFFGFKRNNYDRVVHFFSGLFLFKPILEIVIFYVGRSIVALIFTFTIIVTIATIYEILEWIAVISFHTDLGIAFLGAQGDIWDAQQDIFVAMIGALINVIIFHKIMKIKID